MDPFSALGVAASIIACIQLSGALLKRIGPSDHSKKELYTTLQVLTAFKGAYEGLGTLLEFSDGDDARIAAIKHLEGPLQESKTLLDFLQRRLDSVNFIGQHITGAPWDRKFKKALQRLKETKELLEFVMQAEQR